MLQLPGDSVVRKARRTISRVTAANAVVLVLAPPTAVGAAVACLSQSLGTGKNLMKGLFNQHNHTRDNSVIFESQTNPADSIIQQPLADINRSISRLTVPQPNTSSGEVKTFVPNSNQFQLAPVLDDPRQSPISSPILSGNNLIDDSAITDRKTDVCPMKTEILFRSLPEKN